MERPYVLGVDLDGVCGDYTDAFRTVVAEELGCELDDLPLERSWDFTEWGLDSEEFERLHHHAVTKRRILRWMPVIDSAADTLWRLSDAGVWIRIITHRLYVNWSHATAISATAISTRHHYHYQYTFRPSRACRREEEPPAQSRSRPAW